MGRLTGHIRFGSFWPRKEPEDLPEQDTELGEQEEALLDAPHPFWEHSIRTQWLTQTVSVMVLILLFSVVVVCVTTSSLMLTSMRSNLTSRVSSAVNFFNRYASASDSELYAGAKAYVEGYEDRNIVELQFLDNSGRIVYSSSLFASGMQISTEDLSAAMKNVSSSSWRGSDPSSGESILAVSAPIVYPTGEIVAFIRCVSSLRILRSRTLTSGLIATVVALFVLALVVVSNLYFLRSILDPLEQINDTAKQIAQGRYGVHIAPMYSNEIGSLCETINNMSDAISRAEQTKNNFISSVSHELRTPLTAIGGWSETLLAGNADDPAEVERGLTIIRDEASRLTGMVEELLDFSRMERGELRMNMERADILPDLEDVVFMYMDTLQKEGMTLEFHEDEEIPEIVCDRARLRQVFLNILDNARKHGGDGRRILVTVTAPESTVDITIRDFGQGIPPEELPHVLERFYKGSSKARGNGIGLAVADEIVRLHGGKLDIQSALGEGTAVTISLPFAQ